MYKKLYWGLGVLMLLIIGAFVFLIVRNQAEIQEMKREAAAVQKQLQQRNAQQVPQEAHSAPGHFHEDGTFHEGAPEDPIEPNNGIADEPEPSRDYKPAQVEIPEGITDPEVKKAWERVEYIANNIWEWGGVPSNRAVQLIDQLMPPPDGFSGPSAHGDAEETINLLGELAWSGDPRAAEVVATYYCEGIIGGNDPGDALAEIGPPAVPLLLNYLFDDTLGVPSRPVSALGKLAVKHREKIPGIVDHIIIPKLEELVTDYRHQYVVRYFAKEALANLK